MKKSLVNYVLGWVFVVLGAMLIIAAFFVLLTKKGQASGAPAH